MDAETAARIQAFAAIASLLVAFAAVVVAWSAKHVAERAVKVAEESVETARRQIALAGLPYVVIPKAPVFDARRRKIRMDAINGGAMPAFGLKATVWGAKERFVREPGTEATSSQAPSLTAGEPARQISIGVTELRTTGEPGSRWLYDWFVLELRYDGPYGGRVTQTYDWNGAVIWRITKIHVEPSDGAEPISVSISL